MTTTLELRLASESELPAIFAKVHEFWGRGLELQEYVTQRLASPQHRRARWYVALRGETIVSSLGCYPIEFYRGGRPSQGIAIGSVHTRPEYRGQGAAAELLRYVEQIESQRGAALSVLYSDIAPRYYARLGYEICPAYYGWSLPSLRTDADVEAWRLIPFHAAQFLSQMREMYARDHGVRRLAVARSEEYWQHLFPKRPHDSFFWLQPPDGSLRGYARLELAGQSLKITDLALPDSTGDDFFQACRAVLIYATAQSCERVGGWLPNTEPAQRCFTLESRSREITMLKSLGQEPPLSALEIAAAMYFQEIDHV